MLAVRLEDFPWYSVEAENYEAFTISTRSRTLRKAPGDLLF